MKKIYIQPSTTMTVEMTTSSILTGSVEISSNKDIRYGGVDEDGTQEPSARRYNSQWAEDEED